jgi:hypothetical protein
MPPLLLSSISQKGKPAKLRPLIFPNYFGQNNSQLWQFKKERKTPVTRKSTADF